MNFRVWRENARQFEYYVVGQAAELHDGDVLQLGSGVNDGNEHEIYEGDLVYGDSNKNKDKIIFSIGCFCLVNAMMCYESTYWGPEIKIIGNIFEGEKCSLS